MLIELNLLRCLLEYPLCFELSEFAEFVFVKVKFLAHIVLHIRYCLINFFFLFY